VLMGMSNSVRKGVVQAQMTGPVTQGAWGILFWEILIYSCVVGDSLHSGLVGCIMFFGFPFFIGSHPIVTLLSLSFVLAVGAFWGHLHGMGELVHGISLWLDSIGCAFIIFFVTLIINTVLRLFSSDLFS